MARPRPSVRRQRGVGAPVPNDSGSGPARHSEVVRLQVSQVVLLGRPRVAAERNSQRTDEEEKQGEGDQFHVHNLALPLD